MPNNNLEENVSHFILIAPTTKFFASKNCISNSWNSKIAFGEPGSRFPKVFLPCLVDLSSATIQRRAWLGKVAKNAGKRPAVAAMVDLSSPPIQRRASSDRV